MKLPVHALQPLLIDMCVNLGCRNIGVTEHFLNDPQISAVPQQMRSEAVPQRVAATPLRYTCLLYRSPYRVLHAVW